MKKFLKVLLPLLMVILIIASICWYLFVFDRAILQELLLYSARKCTDDGNYKAASWFYAQAYNHSGQDDQVAMELAGAYLAEGNLTKTEYTLSTAISKGGSSELYSMLCRVYLMQDKILDAVTMLDKISDPQIKAEIDAIRPQAPTVTPEPGFYNQYIHVSFQYEGGQLYYTTNGEYPSQESPAYSEPFALSGGETLLYAVVVGDNGLVSPMAVYGYTVGGVIEPVQLQDEAIEKALREYLGKTASEKIYTNELWSILKFTLPEDAQSLEDLRYLPYLRSLTISGSGMVGGDALVNLQQLEELVIIDSKISTKTMETVASLPHLIKLTMQDCGLISIQPLANAQNLVYLDVSRNSIQDLSVLSGMKQLEELNLSQNAITAVGPVSGLSNLKKLNMGNNALTNIASLGACKALTWLDVSKNRLTALDSIDVLTELTYLNASSNSLADVLVLGSCQKLQELDLSNNVLINLDVLAKMTGVMYLNVSNNYLTVLPALDKDCALVTFQGENNYLTDISSLGGLGSLNNVYITNNAISDISFLATCPNMVRIHAYGNPIPFENAQPLIDMGIVVQYDPTLAEATTPSEP